MFRITTGIVLAGGEGRRMWPITEPKPLVPYAGGTMLMHAIRKMKEAGIEDIIVVGNGDNRIVEEAKRCGAKHITQKRSGSGGALWSARNKANERFFAMAVDSYCEVKDIKDLIKREGNVVSVKKVDTENEYGKVVEKAGKVVRIDEGKKGGGLVNTSLYVFEPEIFDELEQAEEHVNGEVYLTDVVTGANLYRLKGNWVDMGYPWDVLKANELESEKLKAKIKGKVRGTKVKGKLVVEEGATVENSFIYGNVYIGRGCVVGPNSMISGSVCLMEGVEIGFGTIVKNSIIMEGTKAKHLSYIGDSVIGKSVNFGAGSLISNLRFDKKEVRCHSNGLVSTGRIKFGAVVGNGVEIGVNANIMPGTLIKENMHIAPGHSVKGRVE